MTYIFVISLLFMD